MIRKLLAGFVLSLMFSPSWAAQLTDDPAVEAAVSGAVASLGAQGQLGSVLKSAADLAKQYPDYAAAIAAYFADSYQQWAANIAGAVTKAVPSQADAIASAVSTAVPGQASAIRASVAANSASGSTVGGGEGGGMEFSDAEENPAQVEGVHPTS